MGGNGTRVGENATNLIVLIEIQLDFCKLLVNFQSCEKLILIFFSSYFIAFIEGESFRHPHSTIFTDVTP